MEILLKALMFKSYKKSPFGHLYLSYTVCVMCVWAVNRHFTTAINSQNWIVQMCYLLRPLAFVDVCALK